MPDNNTLQQLEHLDNPDRDQTRARRGHAVMSMAVETTASESVSPFQPCED